MTDEFDWTEENLTKVLESRVAYEWPHSAHFNPSRAELEVWLRTNCHGEWKIFLGLHEKIVYFKDANDFALYQLTWHEL